MGQDRTDPLNPYAYLAGIVSLGPTKCGTAGYPGNIEFLLFFCFFWLISLRFPIALITFTFVFITFIRCIHGNE